MLVPGSPLPASNFPHARPASCRARSGRVPSPAELRSPRAGKEPGGGGRTHAPAGRATHALAARLAPRRRRRPGSTASRMSARPAGPEDARRSAAPACARRSHAPARPARSAGPRGAPGPVPTASRPAGPPPLPGTPPRLGPRPGQLLSLPPATSRPSPAAPFLPAGRAGLRGGRSRLRGGLRRPGPAVSVLGAPGRVCGLLGGGAAVKQQSARREEGKGRTRRGRESPGGRLRRAAIPPQSGSNNQFIIEAPNNCEGQRKRQVSSDRLPRGHAPTLAAYRLPAAAMTPRASANRLRRSRCAAAAATDVAVASASPRRKRFCSPPSPPGARREGGRARARRTQPAGWLARARARR